MSTVEKQEQCLIEKCSFGGLELYSHFVFQGNGMNLEQVQKESELRRSRGISDGDLVMVFNHLPQDMANEEVLLLVNYKPTAAATVKSSFPINTTLPPVPPNPIQKQQQPHHHLKKLPADVLPMVRRSSISRFLESRKNRMMARAPYN